MPEDYSENGEYYSTHQLIRLIICSRLTPFHTINTAKTAKPNFTPVSGILTTLSLCLGIRQNIWEYGVSHLDMVSGIILLLV